MDQRLQQELLSLFGGATSDDTEDAERDALKGEGTIASIVAMIKHSCVLVIDLAILAFFAGATAAIVTYLFGVGWGIFL